MKDSRFIELLNLYIDRQITTQETAELEAEIQGNPKRQAVYRQYCQIHSATKQVYASFRTNTEPQPAVDSSRTGVIELFESRRRRTHWAIYTSGLAAAACLALVFVGIDPSSGPSAIPQAGTKPQPASIAQVPDAPVPQVSTQVAAIDNQPGMLSLRNTTAVAPDYTAMLAHMREQDEERAFSSERIYVGGTQSLFGDQVFDAQGLLPAQNQRIYRSRPATGAQGQTEFTAFQFQR